MFFRDTRTQGDWIQEEAYRASKVPGRQTVQRADIWAVLMALMVWGGSYDLEIIMDASYTVDGMQHLARTKNSRGPNRDIWSLIYSEMDKKHVAGLLIIAKVKSYIHGKQAYCRETPAWQIMGLADYAADVYSDHFG